MCSLTVSVLVVSFNTRQMTIDCIRSIFAETKSIDFEVIVWDNYSSDGSADAINEAFGDRVRLIRSPANLGFAAANNRAAALAKGKMLLLLNPDTLVLDAAIDKLVAFSNRRVDAAIWGGKTLAGDGTLDPSSCWGRQTLWSLFCQAIGFSVVFHKSTLFNPEGIGGWERQGERRVDIVCGCLLLISAEFWRRLGGFREEFFMYGEEADLCLRAAEMGARPVVTSEATIIHYGGKSESVFADKLVRLLKAKRLLIDMHFHPWTRSIGRALLFLWPVRRYLIHAVLATMGRKASIEPRAAWKAAVTRRQEWYA